MTNSQTEFARKQDVRSFGRVVSVHRMRVGATLEVQVVNVEMSEFVRATAHHHYARGRWALQRRQQQVREQEMACTQTAHEYQPSTGTVLYMYSCSRRRVQYSWEHGLSGREQCTVCLFVCVCVCVFNNCISYRNGWRQSSSRVHQRSARALEGLEVIFCRSLI